MESSLSPVAVHGLKRVKRAAPRRWTRASRKRTQRCSTRPAHRRRERFRQRPDETYTLAEQRYGASVQARVHELIAGRRRELFLLRRYHDDGRRIAVLSAPHGIDRAKLRLRSVQLILDAFITSTRQGSPAGPIKRRSRAGLVFQTQSFHTQFPDVVLLQEDVYAAETRTLVHTEWRLQRTTHRVRMDQVKQWLELASLTVGLVQAVQGRG